MTYSEVLVSVTGLIELLVHDAADDVLCVLAMDVEQALKHLRSALASDPFPL